MGKAGRWLKAFLAGKNKEKPLPRQQEQQGDETPMPATHREKKRWSFRRSAQGQTAAPSPPDTGLPGLSVSGRELDLDRSERAVAAAVEDAASVAATIARLTAVEDAAAARIQATFRGYLARKALCALRGLVKLQALVRGQLVRRQANATLRRMQALVSAQSRLRARMLQDHPAVPQRRSPQHPKHRRSYEMDRFGEEHIKIVEMDTGEPGRSSCSAAAIGSRREPRLAEYYYEQCSFADELSPRARSGHLEQDALAFDPASAARSSPYFPAVDAGLVPSYMANTESSRAKARSQSAPRQRTHALDLQPGRRRSAAATRRTMQRSSSHIGVPAAAACGYHQHPWSGVRLDRSTASLVGSECGSSSSVLTAATVGYCRSLVGFEVNRHHY